MLTILQAYRYKMAFFTIKTQPEWSWYLCIEIMKKKKTRLIFLWRILAASFKMIWRNSNNAAWINYRNYTKIRI